MNDEPPPPPVRRRVRRLLEAIDRALAAAREVEQARDALVRESSRLRQLRVVGATQEATDEGE
jgi:hypothetical protein